MFEGFDLKGGAIFPPLTFISPHRNLKLLPIDKGIVVAPLNVLNETLVCIVFFFDEYY